MEFITIHDLSRELNVPARVIRYRLIALIAEGKLKEQDDFRRDDYKDDQHFVWKINPLSFMRATALKPSTPVNQINNHLITPATNTGNQSGKSVVNAGDELLPKVNQAGNNPSSSVNEQGSTGNKSDTKEPSLEREMIDLLKEQVKVKDGQLKEQGEQLKDLNDLNVKLTGTMLQQNQKIENLLRLTGGKSDMVNREETVVDQPANEGKSEDMGEAV